MAKPPWLSKANQRGIIHGYRSGLEDNIAQDLHKRGIPVLFESFKIPYVIPQSTHKYTPDFVLPNGIIVEGKGIFDAQDRTKHLLIKQQYPELDIRFVFTRSKAPTGLGAKSSMADWCNKFGFQYADKLIPTAWLDESGPRRKHPEVLKEGPYGYIIQLTPTPRGRKGTTAPKA